MKNINKSLIQLTGLMNSDKKFAFINISKSSIIGLNKKNEKSFPPNVSKEIINSINLSGDRVMKNVSYDLMKEVQDGKYSTIGLNKETYYHYPNAFEYYFENPFLQKKKKFCVVYEESYDQDLLYSYSYSYLS